MLLSKEGKNNFNGLTQRLSGNTLLLKFMKDDLNKNIILIFNLTFK